MPDLWERVTGLFAVTVDVFTQVSIMSASASTPLLAFNHHGSAENPTARGAGHRQRWRSCRGPDLYCDWPNKVCSHHKGSDPVSLSVQRICRSSNSLELSVFVELAVASARKQQQLSLGAKPTVCIHNLDRLVCLHHQLQAVR